MNKAALNKLYGTDDINDIYKKKSEGTQYKTVGCKPNRVKMTAEVCRKLCEAVGLEYLDGYEGRIIEHTITDASQDRYGDVVVPSGVDYKTNYSKNPTIQYSHDYKSPPIGKSIKVWFDKKDKNVKSYGLYFDDRVDSSGFANMIFNFIASNAMPACSIGFVPKDGKVRFPKNEDEREEMGVGTYGVLFEEVDLLEYSPCSIGANPNALKNSIEKSIKDKAFGKREFDLLNNKEFGEGVLDISNEILDEICKEVEEQIEKTEPVEDNKTDELIEKFIEVSKELIESNQKVIDSNLELKQQVSEINTVLKPKSEDSPDNDLSSVQEEESVDIDDVFGDTDVTINLENNKGDDDE